jgi:catechol 2,3-dioxygenase-like lactoylglutathione lyase family enzyme
MEAKSALSHVSLGTNNFEQAKDFYSEVLASLGIVKIEEFPGAIAFGRQYPEFWVQTPFNNEKAEVANGVHVAFLANTPAEVDAFHKKALELGATCDGAPGPRPLYGAGYYGAFVLDLEGHKIEAMHWDETAE